MAQRRLNISLPRESPHGIWMSIYIYVGIMRAAYTMSVTTTEQTQMLFDAWLISCRMRR